MAQRISRGYLRGLLAEPDVHELPDLLSWAEDIQGAVGLAVEALRARDISWREIGEVLGVTGEAARQRWSGELENLPIGAGVYALCDPRTGERRYVGQSLCIAARICTYRAGRAHSYALREWLLGDGKHFTVEILFEGHPAEVDQQEADWIAKLSSTGRLLNVMAGRKRGLLGPVRPNQCPATEARWAGQRRIPPVRVQCSLKAGHEGEHVRSGVKFGRQPSTSVYSRYQLRTYGRVVSLEDESA